jgi:hypothetical protein
MKRSSSIRVGIIAMKAGSLGSRATLRRAAGALLAAPLSRNALIDVG